MVESDAIRKDAEARAAEVDRRLASLESEIAALRNAAQTEGEAERQRLARHTEAEIAKIQSHSEQEIASAAKAARADLKRYSAELAIDLAEQKLRARMGILPGHAALLTQLGTGQLTYTSGGRTRALSLQGGFAEVLPGNVRVLANLAVPAEEVDVERARRELQEAEQQVINPALGVDPAVALDAMAWAQARVDAASEK